MANSVSLTNLRKLARLYADERGVTDPTNDGFVNTTELTMLLNLELRSLYDRLVAANGHDYYESQASFTTVSGTSEYQLASMTPTASTFYRMRRVQLEWGDRDLEEVQDYAKREELDIENRGTWGAWGPKAYRIIGTKVRFVPEPTSAVRVRITYVPTFTDLSSATGGASTFDSVNGWHDAVCLGVAAKILDLQNLTSQHLSQRRDEVLARIDEMAAERSADLPKRMLDVAPDSLYPGRGRLWGLPRP